MFSIPNNLKVVIGLGAAIVGAFTAYAASVEGLEVTEDKINDLHDRFKNRKNTESELTE
jgi:hypothetical protein